MDEGHVREEIVCHTVPHEARLCGEPAAVRRLHHQIFNVHDCRYHVQCLDMVRQDYAQLASVYE